MQLNRQIVLDTETTGLDPKEGHRVIEVGCLELVNRRITGSTFHHYINPEREIERDAQDVHGITNAFLQDKPLFSDIIDALIDYIRDAELIIHNAPFDVNFLNHEFEWAGKQYLPVTSYATVFDTLTFARRKHPGQQNSLDALCRRYEVNNSQRELHGALLDAELLAQVYLLMTGGQAQLFQVEQTQAATTVVDAAVYRFPSDRSPLPVISPTPEELSAHEAFLTLFDDA